MKAFILIEADFEKLILRIDRNPQHGDTGGSSRATPTQEQLMIEKEAHRFFNFQIRSWIDEVKK